MSTLQWTSLAKTINGTTNLTLEPPPSKATTMPSSLTGSKGPRRALTAIGVRFISHEVKRDHRDLEILYKGLMQAVDEGDMEAALQLQNQFGWELARHLIAVQLFIFPGTEQRAEQGNSNALRRKGELGCVSVFWLSFPP